MRRDLFKSALTGGERRRYLGKLAMVLLNLGALLVGVARDPRVPVRAKVFAGAAAAYAISPIDLVPDFLPVIGKTDDVLVVALALDHLIREAGMSVLRDHWKGSEQALSAIVEVVGVVASLVPRPVRVALDHYLRAGRNRG